MLRERVLSGLLLGVPVLAMVIIGGHLFTLLALLVISISSIEFVHLVARRGHRAFGGLMLLWSALFVAGHLWPESLFIRPCAALLLLLTMLWSLARFRQGTANAMTGFAMTLAGSFYIGWSGAHFVSLRALDDGLFWLLTVLGSVWVSDSAAYLVGRAIGRTPLIPDISPGKTWEGYIGGIVFGTLGGATLPLLWSLLGAGAEVSPLHGLVIGALSSVVAPLGDFGISMLKRYAGAKNASNLIPGHGGLLDRIDSLIVAGLLSYYYLILIAL
ncbi:MAG TPA: CDP-archaeol synthase [Chloroflexi bacterium]|nr:CDP-archaeol synthase [Chloroflexota bacterium]